MLKKLLSTILAVSLMLSLTFVVNTAAATTPYANLDLSSKNIGDVISSHGGHQTKTVVVLEDGEKAVVMAPNLTQYDLNGTTVKLLNYAGVSGSAALSASNPKGIVFESTLKITSSSDALILVTNTGNVSPRYLTLSGGNVKYNSTFNTSNVLTTGLTYPINTWFSIKLAWNMTTGYMEISIKDISSGTETTKALENTNWIKSAADLTAVQTFSWFLDGSSGYAYIRSLSVLTEDDAEEIAPSHTLVRDDFDNYTDALTGWSGSGTVATTDRGKSALVDCAVAETKIYKTVTLPSDVKGLVSEFSVKLSTTSGTEFIYAADNGDWYTGAKRLLQFASNGKITAFNGGIEARTYSADTWYDIRVENNFTNGFTRISIFDGLNETVVEKNYEALSTTYASPADIIKRFEFVSSSATTKSIYIDDINIYWLNATEVSGLANPRTYSIHNEFENFTEGNMQDDLVADVTCDASKSFYATPVENEFSVGIESLPNSGRGKSFKATNITGNASREFYRDFQAIQNGIIEFDMMLAEKNGAVAIENQVSTSTNGDMGYVATLRFTAEGKITDGTGAQELGNYDADKWYHVVLTSGTHEIESESHTAILAQVYGDNGLVAQNTVATDSDSTSRDSVRNAKVTIGGANTVYVDNFKAYASTGAQGLFPTPSHHLRNKQVAPDGALTIAFSKVINLANSKFKVNGDEVSATLLGGNVVKLNKALEEGETYEIEYKAADIDGYTTSGYIGNITVPRALIIEDYSAATPENPTASVKVTINSSNASKRVQLIVAAYNGDGTRLLDVDIQSAAAGEGEQMLTATVDNAGDAIIKTFLWDGASLTPIETE